MKTGTRIYYTGDMANVSDFGAITRIIEADKFAPLRYDIKMDDGRVFRQVYDLSFAPGAGRRFMTEAEYLADRAIKISQMEAAYKRLQSNNQL